MYVRLYTLLLLLLLSDFNFNDEINMILKIVLSNQSPFWIFTTDTIHGLDLFGGFTSKMIYNGTTCVLYDDNIQVLLVPIIFIKRKHHI